MGSEPTKWADKILYTTLYPWRDIAFEAKHAKYILSIMCTTDPFVLAVGRRQSDMDFVTEHGYRMQQGLQFYEITRIKYPDHLSINLDSWRVTLKHNKKAKPKIKKKYKNRHERLIVILFKCKHRNIILKQKFLIMIIW